jgi:uncharacterized phage protein (TIGR02220 family)
MGIYRVKKNSNFVVLNKTSLNDPNLTWKAKGLLAYMLSKPDDWLFYDTELEKHAKDGRESLKAAIKELKKHGYMKRERKRNEDGKFDYETSVFETPHTEKPLTEKPCTEKPCTVKPLTENPQLLNNDELSIDVLNNDELSIDKIPFVEIVNYLNSAANTNYKSSTRKTKELIKARTKEGFILNDFYKVIDNKVDEWQGTDMEKFLRPETLFGTKFESYLNQKQSRQVPKAFASMQEWLREGEQ